MANLRLPVIGSVQNIEKALADGYIQPNSYVFATDVQKFVFIDANKQMILVKGNNIQHCDSLPTEGNIDTLYVVGDDIYTFDGTDFVSPLSPIYTKLDELNNIIGDLGDRTVSEYVQESQQETIDYTDQQVETINETLGMLKVLL